jgi:mono/diheme cytochrome c family protein
MSLADLYPKNRLTAFIARHRRRFLLGATVSGFFGLIIPALLIGGNHVVQVLDSTAFCTETCHDVHYAEAVTFTESPHSEVPCASCHVGTGTANLVMSKLNGLRDIIPAITGNYHFPFEVPLKNRRPSSETCEKCHWSEKFLGDVPQIKVSYNADEANTRTVVTHVLKVGGGKAEVAGGIHWHSSAKIWYLPVDDKLQKIAWISSENASGEVTEYVDPNLMQGVTPERIAAEKRLMDCMDCHNRTTHLFRPPDELIDASMADGRIDAGLPFIKREAVKALVPQNDTLQQAYDKIAGIEDFYRSTSPATIRDKSASLSAAITRLKEIARLTTFDKGLDWNTYSDNAKHDKPDAAMQIDWATLSVSDTSPGCFRCHGNLVKAGGSAGSQPKPGNSAVGISANVTAPGGGPGPGRLGADCDTCHYTLKSDQTSPLAPATSHPIDGLDDCLVCHAPAASKPFKADHPWSTNEACGSCHQSAPKLKTLPSAKPPTDAKDTPHPTIKLEDCLLCHGSTGSSPVSKDHPWSPNDTCGSCHKAAPVLKPIPSAAPQAAKAITHPTAGLEDCLACHGPTALKPFRADHPWSTNATCATCHKSGAATSFPVSASPLGSPVTHSLQGLPACSGCHTQSGPAAFPASHVGRPDSFCAICHRAASTPAPAPAAGPLVGPPVLHATGGLPSCTTCHYPSGPGPFPTGHAGRPNSFCAICHKAGGAPPAIPGSLSARAASAGRADLTWIDGATDETGFRLERAANSAFTSALATFTVGANSVSYSDTTLSGSTTYFYRVFATNAAGDSPASNTASVTTLSATGIVPAAPTSLSAVAASANRVDLAWVDNAGNETGFRLERATDAGFSTGFSSFTAAANTMGYSDTTVSGGNTYYYRIFATSAAGSSPASNTSAATTPAAVVDAAALYSTNCALCHGATRQGGAGPALNISTLATRTESWIANFLTTHNTGQSLTTTERPALAQWLKATAGPAPAPTAATALAGTAVSASRIDLTWVDNAGDETGFRLERAANSAFTSGLATFTVGANTVSYSDTTLSAGTTYFYRVFATNAAGDSTASNTGSATTLAAAVTVPAAPSSLAATASSASRIDLTWVDNAGNETGFRIQRSTNGTFSANLVSAAAAAGAVSYSDTTLSAGTTYFYRVFATNAAGDSAASSTASATTPAAPVTVPAAPSSLAATPVSATRVDLTWTDASNNEAGFVVQRATNTAFTTGTTSFTTAPNTSTYSDTAVAAGTSYYYRVSASNTAGSSAPSNTVSATTPAAPINASQLYSSNCASCHGVNRQGSAGPALTAAALSGRTESWMTTFLSSHNTGRNLTSAQRTALVQWLKATP